MFKKKATSKVATAATAATAATTSKSKTLALIQKHHKIVEEARRQQEELNMIAAEEQQKQQQLTAQKKMMEETVVRRNSYSQNRVKTAAMSLPPLRPVSSPTVAAAALSAQESTDTSSIATVGASVSSKASSNGNNSNTNLFATLVDEFLSSSEKLADLDEVIQRDTTAAATAGSAAAIPGSSQKPQLGRDATARPIQPAILTFRSFAASLICPKKFYLLQHRPDLVPKTSVGEIMHIEDGVSFNELARRWDRFQFGSKAVTIKESDFAQAAQHTEELIVQYFQGPYASFGEQAPSLTIHRPAFGFLYDGGHAAAATYGAAVQPIELRARPAVLRYRPKENQWVLLESHATIDPISTPLRVAQSLQRFHFSILCFRHAMTQAHIPIEVRKKFFDVDLDAITANNQKGMQLESSARASAAIDMKRSGLLHIRQYFPGPATLTDCDPPRLVKFIQRMALEDLLLEDSKHYIRGGGHSRGSSPSCNATGNGNGGGAFDLQNCSAALAEEPSLSALTEPMKSLASKMVGNAQSRSNRSSRQKEKNEQDLLELQQLFIEEVLQHHILPLVQQQASDPEQVLRWTRFSKDDGAAGFAMSCCGSCKPATAVVKRSSRRLTSKQRSKAVAAMGLADAEGPVGGSERDGTIPPCYSESVGSHCLRGGDACPFFTEGLCLPRKMEDPMASKDNHIFTLPSASLVRKAAWWAEGKRTISDLLHAFQSGERHIRLTAPQVRYATALTRGQVAINPGEIDAFFRRIRYPLFVIDFEAVQFALPPFAKEVAYQSVPFQFSLDVFQHDVLTETPRHYNHLHFGKGCSPNEDPRLSCITELMRIVKAERETKRAALEQSGELARHQAEAAAKAEAEAAVASRRRRPKKTKSVEVAAPKTEDLQHLHEGSFIAHFASFEKTCLEKLGQLVETHKEDIKNFYFLDTMDLIKKGFLHPNAHGSNSLKKVLPALCPDFQYGVFGTEQTMEAAADASDGQDEQKGENAMGVYRLWYHLEGGGALPNTEQAGVGSTLSLPQTRTTLSQVERDALWTTLRIQLLEYCSLDTKALYEIMREIHKERQAIPVDAGEDNGEWVFIDPTPREVSL